jgi:hypothetical protein
MLLRLNMEAFEVLLDLGVEEVYGRQGVELSRVDLNMQKVGTADILSPLLIKGLSAMKTFKGPGVSWAPSPPLAQVMHSPL